MESSRSLLPDPDNLAVGLMSVFTDVRSSGCITIVNREPTPYASTFPCEIVTCRFQDGSEIRVFCKYPSGFHDTCHGHRGGLEYEIAVYAEVLQPLVLSKPRFFGRQADSIVGQPWLVLECLDNNLQLHKAPNSAALILAARWIAQFHKAGEARLASGAVPALNAAHDEYYLGWVRRTFEFASCMQPGLAK